MSEQNITHVVWTLQARQALKEILDYRYKDIPEARKIVRKEIISTSKEIVFAEQYQRDPISPSYRRIIVRDYKLLYKAEKGTAYIMNVVCTKAK
jgi:plasmid stabilization system protein ParE